MKAFQTCLLPPLLRRLASAAGLARTLVCLALTMLGLAVVLVGAPPQFAVDWSAVAGGGGRSTGGVYAVSGTIGQPDAGTISGGDFALVGGFWGVIAAVQAPGAPTLTAWRTAQNTVLVLWPAPAVGWRLQATANLVGERTVWTEIPPPYQTNEENMIFFTEPAPVGNKFYRLHKP
jgi:hypothetical protein